MGRFIVRRLLGLIPTLLIVITASFFIIRRAPGNCFDSERSIAPEVRADLEAKYHLDKPVLVQYFYYLGSLAKGDLGLSCKYPQRTVNELIGLAFPQTLKLAGVALVWALLIGLIAGIIGAIRQNTAWDYSAMTLAMIGISVPTFVIGPLLILWLAIKWPIFPPAGWGGFQHLLLPGITLGTAYAAYIARLTRGGLLDVIRSDFIRTARSKGLREAVVIRRHMLKGGVLPVVTFLGPAIAGLMVGSIVVEKIFATPGLGPYFVDAAFNRDYNLVMGIVILDSSLLLLMNLVVDIAYGFLDPRVRYD